MVSIQISSKLQVVSDGSWRPVKEEPFICVCVVCVVRLLC